MSPQLFDTIAPYYNGYREADSGLVNALARLLPEKGTVLEIGAGSGNYSAALMQRGFDVIALEPSIEMQRRAKNQNIPWLTATAENIPNDLKSVDAVLMVMSIHHIKDLDDVLKTIKSICQHLVIFTWDPFTMTRCWINDYFPEALLLAKKQFKPTYLLKSQLENALEFPIAVKPFIISEHFKDQFIPAAWKNPWLYLNQDFLRATSGFSQLDQELLKQRQTRLKNDLSNQVFAKKHGHILKQKHLDIGTRILYSHPLLRG